MNAFDPTVFNFGAVKLFKVGRLLNHILPPRNSRSGKLIDVGFGSSILTARIVNHLKPFVIFRMFGRWKAPV